MRSYEIRNQCSCSDIFARATVSAGDIAEERNGRTMDDDYQERAVVKTMMRSETEKVAPNASVGLRETINHDNGTIIGS